MVKYSLKYTDHTPIYFPEKVLSFYPGGKTLPDGDNIILVSEKEKSALLKRKNGSTPIFMEVATEKKSKSEDK